MPGRNVAQGEDSAQAPSSTNREAIATAAVVTGALLTIVFIRGSFRRVTF